MEIELNEGHPADRWFLERLSSECGARRLLCDALAAHLEMSLRLIPSYQN